MTTHEKFKKQKKNQASQKRKKKKKKGKSGLFLIFAPSCCLSSVFYPLFSHSSHALREYTTT